MSSEKQRIPGWTDRILYKGNHLKLLQYARAELYTSDHRPGTYIILYESFQYTDGRNVLVLALFEADVSVLG